MRRPALKDLNSTPALRNAVSGGGSVSKRFLRLR
jgi:hypothetical protein